MTLKELYSVVNPIKTKNHMILTELLESGAPVVAEGKHDTGTVSVFKNGYILYTEDDRWTIFHISEVMRSGVRYETDKESIVPRKTRVLNASFFYEKDWILGIVMEGNRRMIENGDRVFRKWVEFHYSEYSEEMEQLCFIPQYEIEDDISDWIHTQIVELQKHITPSQWNVFVNITAFGVTEKELAERMHITQQTVSTCYRRAVNNIHKAKRKISKDKM